MEYKYCVLIHSKFSDNCKKVMKLLEETSVDVGDILKLNLLCIDTRQCRDAVLLDSKLDVKVVPTLLIMFPNGVVKKMDGNQVIDMIEQTIIDNTMEETENGTKSEVMFSEVNDVMSEDDKFSVDENLNSDETNCYDNSAEIERPLVSMYNGTGGSVLSNDFGEMIEENREAGHMVKSSTTSITDGNSIESIVSKMKKERNTDDEIHKRGMPRIV